MFASPVSWVGGEKKSVKYGVIHNLWFRRYSLCAFETESETNSLSLLVFCVCEREHNLFEEILERNTNFYDTWV